MQPIRMNGFYSFIIVCFFWGTRSLCFGDVPIVTNVIAVCPFSEKQSDGNIVAYFERGERIVFNLALSDVRNSTEFRVKQVIFSRQWARNWDECDVWVTPSKKTLCVLLGEKSQGYGHIYELLFFCYKANDSVANLYPQHSAKQAGDKDQTRPLPVNTILRAYLESDAPAKQSEDHKIVVRNVSGVHFASRDNSQNCEIVGTINGTWRFSLRILLDEESGNWNVLRPILNELPK